MRKILLFGLMAVLCSIFAACNDSTCHISGTVPDKYEGKKIFLVPLTDSRAEVVDSVVITNGKFEFVRDTVMMAKILIDYHYRMGVEPLLVVVEPGQVNVTIDAVSSASGTPQNDSLQQWKIRKQEHDSQYAMMRRVADGFRLSGDTVEAKKEQERATKYHVEFKKYTRQLAENLKEGVLHDFLGAMYPTTYQRLMPDSTTVTFDADTNEPIQ